MRKFTTGVVAVAILAALGMSAPAIATADTSSSTTTTIHVNHGSTTPWKTWRTAENAYLAQLHAINRTFRVSVSTARREYRLAIRASIGSPNRLAARTAARAALTLSIANAMQARATALTALGAPPAPPAGTPRSAYIDSLQAINQTYRNAVAAADATFATTFPSATTAAERATVRATLELAIANAAVARAAALVALGPPPVNSGAAPTTTTTVASTTTTL
jgi:ABC-type glycerol-3-phosphate transport system substrate-binding protein